MVARNFSPHDTPFSHLLQVPDETNEFINLSDLKNSNESLLNLDYTSGRDVIPNISDILSNQQDQSDGKSTMSLMAVHQNQTVMNSNYREQEHIYYDLNTRQTTNEQYQSLYLNDMNSALEPTNCQQVANSMSTTDQLTIPNLQDLENSSEVSNQNYYKNEEGNSNRKRKYSKAETSDQEDDGIDDAKSCKTTDDNKKQNHSEIEKRRRDKMNTYITELSSMVPMCNAMSRKLDKLTVLRMAVQHLKTIRGAVHSYTEGHYKPAFLSDQELKTLILQAADGFLFVVGCDRGRILYVSESVSKTLNVSQVDLLGQSWFDILHPKDVAKVKEQLSSSDLSPRERLIDAKTMLPVKTDVPQGVTRLCPGARRSFFCRMKTKAVHPIKEEPEGHMSSQRRKKQLHADRKYCVIQCTGYLKSWAPAKIGLEENESEQDSCNLSCLVAIGRIPPTVSGLMASKTTQPNLTTIQFMSRHAMDGKFLFVDQRATLVLGYLPQELLGTSVYEFFHADEVSMLAECHKSALQGTEVIITPPYKFRTKDNGFICLKSEWKSFRNPWTKEVEFLIAKNTLILNDQETSSYGFQKDDMGQMTGNFDFLNQSNGKDMHRIINTHVEASKIGRQVAEQVLDYQRRSNGDTSPDESPDRDILPLPAHPLANNIVMNPGILQEHMINGPHERINGTLTNYCQPRVNSTFVASESGGSGSASGSDSDMMRILNNTTDRSQRYNTDGNDEAAMAVIMSLLEADAGLGGPVDFTGLPWPLP